MDVAYISAFAALGGSVVGGLISGSATYLAQRIQAEAALRSQRISRREDIFRDFVAASSRAYGQAVMSDQPDLPDVVNMYGLISRMEILCLPRTIAAARQVARVTIETYFQPNKTFRDILEIVKTDTGVTLLSEFSAAAREELETIGGRYSVRSLWRAIGVHLHP